MSPVPETAVAVFAKAPVAGYAKTRLVPLLGREGAAALQRALADNALRTAIEAGIGPVTLWGAPDATHPWFGLAARRFGLSLLGQGPGDLGRRMLAAFEAMPCEKGLVLIGSDCPSLTSDDLRHAAAALHDGADVALAEAEDGGYGLIAARRPYPMLFHDIPWGTDRVASLTRDRAHGAGLRLVELRRVWDVDTPADYRRAVAAGLVMPVCTEVEGEPPALLHRRNIK